MTRLLAALLALAAAVLAPTGPARAAAGPWFETDHGAVRLIAAANAAGAADRLDFGLQFRMKPGWKIYWRSPGDAGFPPRPEWTGARNVADAAIDWPAPKRFSVLDLETLGYEGEVVLPLAVTVAEPGKAVRLAGTVSYLTCDDICVPYDAELALELPSGPAITGREAGLIETWRARVPSAGDAALAIAAVEAEGPGATAALRVRLTAAEPLVSPDLYVEGPPGLSFAAPRVQFRDGGREAVLRVAVAAPRGAGRDLVGVPLVLTAVDGGRAVERHVVPAPAAGPAAAAVPPPAVPTRGLAAILAIAVLGGLILNLMPCVLPVLSLKLLAVIDARGQAPGRVRARFLATAAGILASFLVLGSVAVGLKAAGLAAGWGIQFQEPVFLAAMALVLVLFAANLWGFFEIALPGAVADAAARPGARGGGVGASFLTGAFATVLATPCSAPFVGTAVGFALARGPVEIYAVFAALGLGLALPYLAVAAWPRLAGVLPRPGRWMVAVRAVLGLALAATAAWLVAVLAAQRGVAAAAAVGVLLLAGLALLWSLRHARMRAAVWAGVAAVALAVLWVPHAPWTSPPGRGEAAGEGDGWQPFDRARIAAEVAAGRVVVVDVTADWCLTCKVNKAVVLDRDEVRRVLAGAVAMRADWTRPDPAIAAYLESFGRYGIPFNVVYGPGAPGGVALPELLTVEAVTTAVDAAAGRVRLGARSAGG